MLNELDQIEVENLPVAQATNEQPEQENESEPENPEVIKLRGKNRELLDEAKLVKTKSKEHLELIESQAARIKELEPIEQDFNNFKKSVIWSHFLDDLRIIPEYRNFISQELAIGGYLVKSDRRSNELKVFDCADDLITANSLQIRGLKDKFGQMFYGSFASGGAGSSPTDPQFWRDRAAQSLQEAEKAEKQLLELRKNPTAAPTTQSVDDALGLRLGIK